MPTNKLVTLKPQLQDKELKSTDSSEEEIMPSHTNTQSVDGSNGTEPTVDGTQSSDSPSTTRLITKMPQDWEIES